MSLPRYRAYKDSGAPWLGAVPVHWSVKRFKWLIERNDGGVWGEDPDGEDDTFVLRSTEQTVDGQWKLDDPARRRLTESERLSAMLAIGDLLVTKSSGSSLHIGKTTLVDEKVAALTPCYSNFMQRLRLTDDLLPKLAWYVMNNDLARVQFDMLSSSTTGLANLSGTMISEILLPVPCLEEQAAIATFLDRETSKIDALVTEQEKLIALLTEKRQAIISHAVTRGINPDTPMKDSGVTWLGQLPAHWEVAALKRFWSVTDCKHITAEFVDDGYPLASIREVQATYVTLEDAKRTTQHFYEQLIDGGRKPVQGDLIFTRNATVGEVAQVTAAHPPFAMGQDVCLLRRISADLSSDFLQAVIRSSVVIEQLKNIMVGSTFRRVNVEDIRNLSVPMPPSAEQVAISMFVNAEATKLDSLHAEAERAIVLLGERRSALIAAAVTGQIDVRGAAPQPAIHEEAAA